MRIVTERGLPYVHELHRSREPGWLSYRLAELLALPLQMKQQLLEVDSAGRRLRMIQTLVEFPGNDRAMG